MVSTKFTFLHVQLTIVNEIELIKMNLIKIEKKNHNQFTIFNEKYISSLLNQDQHGMGQLRERQDDFHAFHSPHFN